MTWQDLVSNIAKAIYRQSRMYFFSLKSAVTSYPLFITGSFRIQRNPGQYCSFSCTEEVDNQLPTFIQLSNYSLASITKNNRTQFTRWENKKIMRMNCKKTSEPVQIKFGVMCSMHRSTKQQINVWFTIFWMRSQSKNKNLRRQNSANRSHFKDTFTFQLSFLFVIIRSFTLYF